MRGERGTLLVRIELNFRNLLLLFALLVVAWVTYLVRDTIVLLGLALMLMATLHPLVQMAERRGLSHSWAVAVVMLALVLVPVAMIAAMTPIIISEVQSFAKSFPTLQQHINELLHNWGVADRVNQAIDKANLQDRIASLAVVSATQTVTIAAKTFTVIVVAGYLLAGSHRLQLMLHAFVPRRSERHIEPLLEGMERVVGGYIRGQILTSAMFGVFGTLLCYALGVPNPLLMGIVAAVGDIIPLFGVPLAMIITVIVAFTQSVWQPIGVVVGYVVYGQIESHFLVPRIYSRAVNMSPLLVIVATVIGGSLDGFVGIFVGIPVAGALKVVLDYIVAERVKGREASERSMLTEPTDMVGKKETEEEHGQGPDAALVHEVEEAVPEGVPPPSYSPFESVPVSEIDVVEKVSGARYLTIAKVRSKQGAPQGGTVKVHHRLRHVPPTGEQETEPEGGSEKQSPAGAGHDPHEIRPRRASG